MNQNEMKNNPVKILIPDRKETGIPVEGSLGLLALGAVGIRAWRQRQKEMNYVNQNEIIRHEKKKKETND